jgi:microcystin-dependent protein
MPSSDLPITFNFAGLPADYCFTSFNRFALDIVAQMAGYVVGSYALFNYGNDEPAVNDRTKPWLRTNADGTFDKIYVFAGGLWVSTHPIPPGSRMIAPSTLLTAADVWAWDGGSGDDPSTTTPSFATGAMWEVDPILTGRVALGSGTMPSGAVVAPNATGGFDTHSLLAAEIPPHTHLIASDEIVTTSINPDAISQVARRHNAAGQDDVNYDLSKGTLDATIGRTSSYGGTGGAVVPMSLLPPYAGVIWMRRTGRLQYVPQ